jgi:hypothetical protein
MTNRIALFVALFIVGVFVADHFYLHWNLPVFLGRELMDLTELVAIWR